MATRDADAPPKGVRSLVTVAHVLPARRSGRAAWALAVPPLSPPWPVAGVVLAVTPQTETCLHN